MTRKLTLNTEHLTELTPAELTGVAGGDVTGHGYLCPTQFPSCIDTCNTLPC